MDIQLPEGSSIPAIPIPTRQEVPVKFDHGTRRISSQMELERLAEIFNDSVQIALTSGNPDTASYRRDLAFDCYYPMREYVMASGNSQLADHMDMVIRILIIMFPAYSKSNTALAIVKKASKLKTASKRTARFQEAEQLMREAEASP